MAPQAGLVLEKTNTPLKVVDNLPRPKPGPKQALVKSLTVALLPVDELMYKYGIMINEWPAVLGSSCCGIVSEAGSQCTKLQRGSYIFCLNRLGQNLYSPFQETFLVDEDLVFTKPDRFTLEEAASVGNPCYTAALGIVSSTGIKVPEQGSEVQARDEWIVVIGGSGSVGQYAIQIARICGFKVLASCSPANESIAKGRGATACFNHKDATDTQIAEIVKVTGGKFRLVFDAGGLGHDVAIKALASSDQTDRVFSTTASTFDFKVPESINFRPVEAGMLGRDEGAGPKTTQDVAHIIADLQDYIDKGGLEPLKIETVKDTGFEALQRALSAYVTKKPQDKVVVVLQHE